MNDTRMSSFEQIFSAPNEMLSVESHRRITLSFYAPFLRTSGAYTPLQTYREVGDSKTSAFGLKKDENEAGNRATRVPIDVCTNLSL